MIDRDYIPLAVYGGGAMLLLVGEIVRSAWTGDDVDEALPTVMLFWPAIAAFFVAIAPFAAIYYGVRWVRLRVRPDPDAYQIAGEREAEALLRGSQP